MPVNKLYCAAHVDDQNGEIVAAENPIKLKMRMVLDNRRYIRFDLDYKKKREKVIISNDAHLPVDNGEEEVV